ncbi:hypothetical protein PMAYCL1PPCAC_03463, partial [Pristionchus mayeri]
SDSMVEFTHSILYDIYDFAQVEEVHIAKCDLGCVIFAATTGETLDKSPNGLDPYAMNLIVVDYEHGTNYSVAELAQQRDEQQRKIPLTITGSGNISVINQNDIRSRRFYTIALYVVEKSKCSQLFNLIY